MKRDIWQVLAICIVTALGSVTGTPSLAQGLEAGKTVTTKERLPLAGAPTPPTIDVPMVVDMDEPEAAEGQIPSPVPPKPPTPPSVQGSTREVLDSPKTRALHLMDQLMQGTATPAKEAPPPKPVVSSPPKVDPVTPVVATPTAPAPVVAAPVEPAPTKEPLSTKPTLPDKPAYLVQVGAMIQAENALSLVEKGQAKGFPVYDLPPDELGKLHRILIGPFDTKAQAEAVAQKWRETFKGKTIITKK